MSFLSRIEELVDLKPLDLKPPASRHSLFLLFSLSIILYANTYNHGFVMDDYLALAENTYVMKGVAGIPDIWTHGYAEGHPFYSLKTVKTIRPVTQSIFAALYQLVGDNSSVYHVFQIHTYGVLCCLLFLFFDRLFQGKYPGLPLLISLIFLFHPIHTEIVANIKSADELFSLTFAIAAGIFFLKFFDHKKWVDLLGALLLYFIALCSKETPITFLAIYPLILFMFRETNVITSLKYGAVFIPMAGIFLFIRWVIFKDLPPPTHSYLDNPLYLADGWTEAVGTRVYLFGYYLWLLLFPVQLTSSYFLMISP